MTDITQLLLAALDPSNRESAEAQLDKLRSENTVLYMTTLADHLGSETVPEAARQLAGLMLKGTLDARDPVRRAALHQTWGQGIPAEARAHVKACAVRGLQTTMRSAARQAAQVVSKIAAIEIPAQAWPELVEMLANNVVNGPADSSGAHIKESALLALGYVCEEVAQVNADAIPPKDANLILTAIYQGMRSQEPEMSVRRAGTIALLNALEFVHGNFEIDKERDLLMTALCECAANPDDEDLKLAAFECLVKVAQLYYDKLPSYMHALFSLTLAAIQGGNESIAMEGIEFWTTIAEEEAAIINDALDRAPEGTDAATALAQSERRCENYTLGALEHVVPVLLTCLMKQSAEVPDDELWDVASAAATCIAQIAQCVGNQVVSPVMNFVQAHISSEDWRQREAAISAFGAILEGPEEDALAQLVKEGVSIMIDRMRDPHPHVRDSSAWALTRICEYFPEKVCENNELLHAVVTSVAELMMDQSPRVATLACWSLYHIAQAFAETAADEDTNALSSYFQPLLVELLKVSERPDALDTKLQTAAYETLNQLVCAAAKDSMHIVRTLVDYVMERIAKTFEMGTVAKGAREVQARTQALLASVMQIITQRLREDIVPHAQRLMELYGMVFQNNDATVHEEALQAVGTLALVLGDRFAQYVPPFMKVLCQGLANAASSEVCTIAVGVMVDLCHAVGRHVAPHCDDVVNVLLNNLKNPHLNQDVRPPILSCFGDIAMAIGGLFEKYLHITMSMLAQASATEVDMDEPELIDYINALRTGIFEAYTGILHGLSEDKKHTLFASYTEGIFEFIGKVHLQEEKDEEVTAAAIALVGDMADALGQPISQQIAQPQIVQFLSACKMSQYSKVSETAAWVESVLQQKF